MTVEQALQLSVQRHQAGDLPGADAILRRILGEHPNQPDALHLLGLLAHQAGHSEIAADLIGRAIAVQPFVADYHINLGVALQTINRIDEAISAYGRGLELRPDSAEALSNLGDALCRKEDWDRVIVVCRRVLELKPNLPEAHCNLGIALQHKRQIDAAIACFKKALQLRPLYLQASNNLGTALAAKRQWVEAIAAYRWVLMMNPKAAETFSNLGDVLSRMGEADWAINSYRGALAMKPDLVGTHHNLGNALYKQGQIAEALAAYSYAGGLKPDDPDIAGDRLMALQLHPDYDAHAILRELCAWDKKFAQPLRNPGAHYPNDASPDRRLRVGYISADFRDHVVGWNLLPLMSHHDHEQFEIFCYSNVTAPDGMTERIRGHADAWRNILDLTDEQTADLIRRDGIDILVDLSLHSAGNRLMVLARKPAPVQVTYLGYAGTTGMSAIDYRFSDPWLDPPGSDLTCYSEKTVCLPRTYWCYKSGGPTPDVQPAPAATHGYVTFGCLGNFAKTSPALDLWGRLLASVPDSRLLLNCPVGSPRTSVQKAFDRHGIAAERVKYVADQPWEKYIETYNRIDVALDPFPYGGAITTCDSLWMGVPVVTLRGRTPVGRAATSILSNIGLANLVAATADDYLRLASDTGSLISLRPTLRQRMIDSPLMDGAQFARDIEGAYRGMWKAWCEKARSD